MGACASKEYSNAFAEAYGLIQAEKWDEAIEALDKELLQSPYNAVAHLYLGRCYLNSLTPYPFLIEGELETALSLVHSGNGTTEPLTPSELELQCYLDLSQLYLWMLRGSIVMQADRAAISEVKNKLVAVIEQANALAPDDPKVKKLVPLLDRLQ